MQKILIPFSTVPQLAKTDLAYSTGDRSLTPFYKYELKNEVFRQIIEDKSTGGTPRELLAEVLEEQYAAIPDNEAVLKLIASLREPNVFTVTTAHQPSLFLGPLYFIYKALTAVNLADAISGLVGGQNKIVPIFVMGSEDHDLEELNHITLFHKKVSWDPATGAGGAVGSIGTDTLALSLERLRIILGETDNAHSIFHRIQRAYTKQPTFAKATQALIHDVLGRFGIVVLDMNHPKLKRQFIPIMESELLEQKSYHLVRTTTEKLNELGFKTQAQPREINLFYMEGASRDRIVPDADGFRLVTSGRTFTKEAILADLHAHPERFSPNVVLRPLYQEIILPNLAYVGGGGELAYWLERKELFEFFGINYPVLVRRNSVLWIDRDASKKMHKFGFSPAQLFQDSDALIRQYIDDNTEAEMSLAHEIADFQRIFDRLEKKATAIDPSLASAVQADAVKLTGQIEQWQSRLLRAEKQRHEVTLVQIRSLKDKLFPGGGLQERSESFIPLYLRYGDRFFDILKEKMLPLEQGFVVLEDI